MDPFLLYKTSKTKESDKGEEDYYGQLMVDDEKEYEIGNRVLKGKQIKDICNDKWFDDLELKFEDALDNNEPYWELFWETADDVIEEEIDRSIPKSEKELKQDTNHEKYRDVIMSIMCS